MWHIVGFLTIAVKGIIPHGWVVVHMLGTLLGQSSIVKETDKVSALREPFCLVKERIYQQMTKTILDGDKCFQGNNLGVLTESDKEKVRNTSLKK